MVLWFRQMKTSVSCFFVQHPLEALFSVIQPQISDFNFADLQMLSLTFKNYLKFCTFYVLYLTLMYLSPLRFHCVRWCWDRTQWKIKDFGKKDSDSKLYKMISWCHKVPLCCSGVSKIKGKPLAFDKLVGHIVKKWLKLVMCMSWPWIVEKYLE